MDRRIVELNGHRLLVLGDEGPALTRVQDVLDLVGKALPQRVSVIVAPVARLDPEFFRLRSGLAGEFVQKIVNYRLRLADRSHTGRRPDMAVGLLRSTHGD